MSKAKEKEALGKYWLSISVVTYVGVVIESFTGGNFDLFNLSVGGVATLVFLRMGLNYVRNSDGGNEKRVNKGVKKWK